MQAFYIKQDNKPRGKYQRELVPHVPIVLKMYLIEHYSLHYYKTSTVTHLDKYSQAYCGLLRIITFDTNGSE